MCRKRNSQTDFVRDFVRLWLSSGKLDSFSVCDVTSSINHDLSILIDVDISKAVSNELQRLESVGIITSRKGVKEDRKGSGRPPRVFTRVYCSDSLMMFKASSGD